MPSSEPASAGTHSGTTAERSDVQSFYDGFSARYLLGDFRVSNLRHEAIKRLCAARIARDARVLEIGCGAGILTRALRERAREVISVDISEVNIRVAGAYATLGNGKFLRGDVSEMHVDDLPGSFDAVLIADVIEHIPLEKHASLFAVIRAKLAPGGVVLLTFPTPEYQEHLKSHQRHLLQAIDETVTLGHLLEVSGLSPLYFAYLDVFGANQYAHLVLTANPQYRPTPASTLAKAWLKLRSLPWHARNFRFLRRIRNELARR